MLSETMGSLGGFFVKPEFRYKGIGQLIWDARMEYLSKLNVIVNSIDSRADKNVRLGLKDSNKDTSIYIGLHKFDHQSKIQTDDVHVDIDKIVQIRDADFDKLMSYDSAVVKDMSSRNGYYKTAIDKYFIRGFVALKEGSVRGMIGETPSNNYTMVGPWYADTPAIASALLARFLSDAPRDINVCVCPPENNEDADKILRKFGLEKVMVTKSLFKLKSCDIQEEKVYGHCNNFLCM